MNNFGISRNMDYAGRSVLKDARNEHAISYETCRTNCTRWDKFSNWAKENGIKKMEQITPETVRSYVSSLQADGLKASTIQNAVGAINSVLSRASDGRWGSVRAVTDLGVEKRTYIRTESPARYDQFKALEARLEPREAALVGLCRELGLREREASLLNAKDALQQAEKNGEILIDRGTKGGQSRVLPVTLPRQMEALRAAAKIQTENRTQNLIPKGQSWIQFRGSTIRNIQREAAAVGVKGLHTLRAAYACDRYQKLTNCPPPCVAGRVVADRDADLEARKIISEELGHHRVDVLSSYIGGRK